MVAVGDIWEGHEIRAEIPGRMLRTFQARQIKDTQELVWLHMKEGVPLQPDDFLAEMRQLQSLSERVPAIDPILYGGFTGTRAWVATPCHTRSIHLKNAFR